MLKKQSCVISIGNVEDKKILFKVRDRKYIPKIRVYHNQINGVEVLYVKDEVTAWIEGINEYGIGIINSALLVKRDENEHLNPIRKKRRSGRVLSRDGNRVLKILSSRNIEEALDMVLNYDAGIKGHTFISDGKTTYSIEHTSKLKPKFRKLKEGANHVRTNHGILHPGAGYEGGDPLNSSMARKKMTERVLRRAKSIKDISTDLFNESAKKKHDFDSSIRLHGEMFTSSLFAFDLKARKMYLYILQDKGDYLGYRREIEGQTSCSFEVYRFNKKNKIEKIDINKPDKFVEDVSRNM